MITKEEAYKLVEKISYSKYDENNKALGCLLPIYLIHPEAYKVEFEFNVADQYVHENLSKWCKKLNDNDSYDYGDIFVFNIPGCTFHFGVYIENYKVLHIMEGGKLDIVSLSIFPRHRIEGRYRIWAGLL